MQRHLRAAPLLVLAMISISNFTRAADAPAPPPSILVKSGQKVAFMGDSITANGTGQPGGYVKLIVDGLEKEGIKVELIPAGVSGNTSKDMLARLDKDVLGKKPDWMTLSCGVNDVWHGVNGVDLETYKTNITSIIDQAAKAGIKVVLLTATPIGEDGNDNNTKLAAYNDFLRQLAKQRNLPLADLNADFQAALKPFAPTPASRNFTVDGVHMNSDGNVIMAEGVLCAFGVPTADVAKIEQAWTEQPGTAFVSCGNFEPKAPVPALSLGQFRAVKAVAIARNINFEQLTASLWLQALGEAMQTHLQDPVVDLEAVKKDAGDRFQQKINDLVKK